MAPVSSERLRDVVYAEERAAARIAAALYNWRRDDPGESGGAVIDLRDPDPDDDDPQHELDPTWDESEREPAFQSPAA